MPGGDRTGPLGLGPRSGRAAGYCAGFGMPGYMNPVVGQGRGMGLGRGWRNRFFATGVPGWSRFGAFNQQPFNDDPEWEKRALKNQLKALESELERVKKRLAEVQEESTGQA